MKGQAEVEKRFLGGELASFFCRETFE
jgi:hypothetical protein